MLFKNMKMYLLIPLILCCSWFEADAGTAQQSGRPCEICCEGTTRGRDYLCSWLKWKCERICYKVCLSGISVVCHHAIWYTDRQCIAILGGETCFDSDFGSSSQYCDDPPPGEDCN